MDLAVRHIHTGDLRKDHTALTSRHGRHNNWACRTLQADDGDEIARRSSTGQDAPSVTRPAPTRSGSRLGDAGSLCPVSRRTPYSTASTFSYWATYATAGAYTSEADSGNRARASRFGAYR